MRTAFYSAFLHLDSTVHVGGQAVIEGVMMRSPERVAVAVRQPNGRIALQVQSALSWTKQFRILGWPLIRGAVILIESLFWGIQALNWSAQVASEDTLRESKPNAQSDKIIWALTLALGFGLGFLLFFYLPLLLTEWLGVKNGVLFNLIDGAFRVGIFLAYLALIQLWKEMRRLFAYHGAEHKSIFAFEQGKPLEVSEVKPFSTHHPRCGTSFLLVVMWVSILVFMVLGRPENLSDRVVRFLMIPLIGGISYEIIRLTNTRYGKWLGQMLVLPGLWLQYFTTKEPDEHQLEVALVALKAALAKPLDKEVEYRES